MIKVNVDAINDFLIIHTIKSFGLCLFQRFDSRLHFSLRYTAVFMIFVTVNSLVTLSDYFL